MLLFDVKEFYETLAAGVPIAIYSGELNTNDLPDNYRIAEISANSQCFNGCNLRFYNFLVAYRGANFNIQPPELAEYKVSVYDAIGHLQERELVYSNDANDGGFDTCLTITQWELDNIIQYLPNGWSTDTILRYHDLLELQLPIREFKRLTWSVAAYLPDGTIGIHPTLNRPLSNGELQFINYDTHLEWLGQQVDLFRANHWGEQDWESKYHAETKQWIGETVAGKYCKRFDLNHYHPMFCPPHDAETKQWLPNYWRADYFTSSRIPRPKIEEL